MGGNVCSRARTSVDVRVSSERSDARRAGARTARIVFEQAKDANDVADDEGDFAVVDEKVGGGYAGGSIIPTKQHELVRVLLRTADAKVNQPTAHASRRTPSSSTPTHLESDQRNTLQRIPNEQEILHRRQRSDMHSNIEESHGQKDLILLKRASIKLLPHGHDEVAVDVAHVAHDGFGVLEEEQLELMVDLRRFGIGHNLDDLKEVDLRRGASARPGTLVAHQPHDDSQLTPPRAARSSARYTVVPTAIKSLRPDAVLLVAKLTVLSVEMNSLGRNS